MWAYDPSLGDRIAALAGSTTFDSIAGLMAREGKVVCAHADTCKDDSQFVRAVYCIQLHARVFDLFFNAWSGYRAAYFRSPDEGLAANAGLVQQLGPLLLAYSKLDRLVDAKA